MRRYVQGWKGESQRHSLARRGVKTGRALHYDGDLNVQYDSRKSFYGKAQVRTEGNRTILRSYSTDVAEIVDGKPVVYGMYSDTTARHIKEFLKQHGFKAESGKQIMKDYGAKESDEKAKSEREESEADSHFKTVAMVSQLGEIFGKTEKEKNDWKTRMLKAGLEGRGLQMPEDWETLSEAEKKKRLDAVIGVLKEKPKKSLTSNGKMKIRTFGRRDLPEFERNSTRISNDIGKRLIAGKQLTERQKEYIKYMKGDAQ
jgi:hypothetical protein